MDNCPVEEETEMKTEEPLTDNDYLLFKTPGKGGWTFAEIPDIPMPKTSFGMMKVKGKIDDHEFSSTHLMPIGNGHVGLAIKAELRKKLKKQAGDTVHITLYEDQTPLVVPEEILLCMEYEEGILEKFETYSIREKKGCIDWICSARTEQAKADRIARTITRVQKGNKLPNKSR